MQPSHSPTALKRVTVLISGRGSNLIALYEHRKGYEITCVISNNRDAKGVSWARNLEIPCRILERSEYQSLKAFKSALLEAVIESDPQIVCLAGLMVVLQPEFVNRFKGQLINIHPSLLPKFPGLDTHERVLAAREVEHGASVHFVSEGIDTGAIIAQVAVPVCCDSDTAETLAARVLDCEHRLYPWVVSKLSSGEISLGADSRVAISEDARAQAKLAGFRLNC
jgi:formyltetrahydrofolate-dependent phosphoribosylglycinamide formyltransferase